MGGQAIRNAVSLDNSPYFILVGYPVKPAFLVAFRI